MFDYMKHITSIEEVGAVLNNEGTHVFLFSAPWCGDCRFIEPFMKEVIESYPNLKFYYVNRDDYIELCQRWDIMGIPSFVAYNNHQEVGRFVSRLRKTKEEITNFLNTL